MRHRAAQRRQTGRGQRSVGTRASFSTTGTCELELWVSDSEFENSTQVSVTVTEAP